MSRAWIDRVQSRLNASVTSHRPLSGGCVGDVYRVDLDGREPVVAKVGGPSDASLAIEAYMLKFLAAQSSLPVPQVLIGDDDLLVMEFIEHERTGGGDKPVDEHAAALLAELHDLRSDAFGLERDTLIGGLHQPNDQSESWIPFFGEHRLVYTAREAEEAGRLPTSMRNRVEALAGRLDRWLAEPHHPSLIHGDVWSGNVLAGGGRVQAFIDPAVYYADPEVELAFTTLFSCFGRSFYDAYAERRGIADGFFEQRCDLYNLYPLLVHVRLFGGGYVLQVESIVRRFGE